MGLGLVGCYENEKMSGYTCMVIMSKLTDEAWCNERDGRGNKAPPARAASPR